MSDDPFTFDPIIVAFFEKEARNAEDYERDLHDPIVALREQLAAALKAKDGEELAYISLKQHVVDCGLEEFEPGLFRNKRAEDTHRIADEYRENWKLAERAKEGRDRDVDELVLRVGELERAIERADVQVQQATKAKEEAERLLAEYSKYEVDHRDQTAIDEAMKK